MSTENNKEFKLSSWAIENKMTIYVVMTLFLFLGLIGLLQYAKRRFPRNKRN